MVETAEGDLELRRRGERDFMIRVGGRVLMTSRLTRSEEALARIGCAPLATRAAPRVLVGGLGLGMTLRAALDALPSDALVTVCELSEAVVTWCRGPAAPASGAALEDPRVEVVVGDVAAHIRAVAADRSRPRYDAILLDLYVGPGPVPHGQADPLYDRASAVRARDALGLGGVYAVWGEAPFPPFERRLHAAGFEVQTHAIQAGGVRHVVFVGTRPGGT
ncbi:MAG: spermidine synthase [Sandaracinaceae bacterium]|nr:spermidine synthase [Sandaracinaceae bacterium]